MAARRDSPGPPALSEPLLSKVAMSPPQKTSDEPADNEKRATFLGKHQMAMISMVAFFLVVWVIGLLTHNPKQARLSPVERAVESVLGPATRAGPRPSSLIAYCAPFYCRLVSLPGSRFASCCSRSSSYTKMASNISDIDCHIACFP